MWSYLFAISIAQGLFLAGLLLFRPSTNQRASMLVAVMVLVMVITNVDNMSTAAGFYQAVPRLYGMSFGMIFLFGPLLLFYTRSVTDPLFTFRRQRIWHLTPYLLNILLNLPFYAIPVDQKLALIDSFIAGELPFNSFSMAMTIVQVLHLAVYLYWTHKILNENKQPQGNVQFVISLNARVKWLTRVFYSFLAYLLLILVLFAYVSINKYFVPTANYSYTLATSVIIYLLALRLTTNPVLMHPGFDRKYGTQNVGSQDPCDASARRFSTRSSQLIIKGRG